MQMGCHEKKLYFPKAKTKMYITGANRRICVRAENTSIMALGGPLPGGWSVIFNWLLSFHLWEELLYINSGNKTNTDDIRAFQNVKKHCYFNV